MLNHFALSEEIPFTEWLGGTFIVSTVAEMSIPLTSQSVREVINCLQSDELNASAIAPKNIESYTLYIWYTPTVSLDNEVKSVRRL